MMEITTISSSSVKPRFGTRAKPSAGLEESLTFYQSEYFVPSSAVPIDRENTSNTSCPPQLEESGSSCTERTPQSASPVNGSTGIRRRNRTCRVTGLDELAAPAGVLSVEGRAEAPAGPLSDGENPVLPGGVIPGPPIPPMPPVPMPPMPPACPVIAVPLVPLGAPAARSTPVTSVARSGG